MASTNNGKDVSNAKLVTGLFAAMGTPRNSEGAIDHPAVRRWVEFLIKGAIDGIVIDGATGEYCFMTTGEVSELTRTVREVTGPEMPVLCGVGAPGLTESVARARAALEHGVNGFLLPMPYFFPYDQDDLVAFATEFATRVPGPILLYNLPGFTTGLEPDTVLRILSAAPNIVGIKDSSGHADILAALTAEAPAACRAIGNDAVIAHVLKAGLCDGVISGVASVFPELLRVIVGDSRDPRYAKAVALLNDLIAQLQPLPVPWGLKWLAEYRGIAPAVFEVPVSSHRREQAAALERWFERRMPELVTME